MKYIIDETFAMDTDYQITKDCLVRGKKISSINVVGTYIAITTKEDKPKEKKTNTAKQAKK